MNLSKFDRWAACGASGAVAGVPTVAVVPMVAGVGGGVSGFEVVREFESDREDEDEFEVEGKLGRIET